MRRKFSMTFRSVAYGGSKSDRHIQAEPAVGRTLARTGGPDDHSPGRQSFKGLLAAAVISVGIAASCMPAANCEPVKSLNCDVGAQLNLPVTEWFDQSVPEKGVIIGVHGLTLYAGAFDDMGRHLASRGYHVYALDMRGFGRWRDEGKKYGGDGAIHVGQSQTDLVRLVQMMRKDNPQRKIYLMGESQGSNLALWIVENHPDLTNGAIIGSPCYHTRVHPSFRWLVDGAREMFTPTKPLDLEPYTRPYLTNDPVLTEKCDNDPQVNREMTPAELVKCLIENKSAIKNARAIPENYPILMFAGTKDGVFKSTGLPKEIKKFGDAGAISLTMLPGKGHLLIEHQPVNPEIGSLIDNWLHEQSDKDLSKVVDKSEVE